MNSVTYLVQSVQVGSPSFSPGMGNTPTAPVIAVTVTPDPNAGVPMVNSTIYIEEPTTAQVELLTAAALASDPAEKQVVFGLTL